MAYPDLRPSKLGHWPPRIELLPPGQPILGEHIGLHRGTLVGWTDRPEASWAPQDGDLLWSPPATKTLDVAGEIVDVKSYANMPGRTWVTSQLTRRDKYLDVIRQRVMGGVYRLTPAVAKLLGLEDDGALLTDDQLKYNERAWSELQATLERTGS